MSIFAAPLGPPFTGVAPLGGQNPTGARKQECLGAVPSGPTGGLSGRKIGVGAVPLLRLGFRTNAPGTYAVGPVWDRPLREKGTASISAVGAAISRLQAFPLGGRCPSAHTGADEGAMIERFRSSQEGFRRLRAATYFAHGGKVGKTPPGTAQDERSALIFALPRTPLRGTRT